MELPNPGAGVNELSLKWCHQVNKYTDSEALLFPSPPSALHPSPWTPKSLTKDPQDGPSREASLLPLHTPMRYIAASHSNIASQATRMMASGILVPIPFATLTASHASKTILH